MSRGSQHLPALDTLRAVGALAVLVTHAAFWAGSYTAHGIWGQVLARLDAGVAVFFVLSGFLLARPWLAAAATRDAGHRGPPRHVDTPRYLRHRALRIVPVYVVTVVLALALLPENRDLGVTDWLSSLLMLDTFTKGSLPAGLSHMWSLAVEVTFYLVLPLLMIAAVGRGPLRPRRVLAVLGAMTLTSTWWHLAGARWAEGRLPGLPAQWLPGYLTWFAVGIGLALAHVLLDVDARPRWAEWLRDLGRQPGVCWALAAALLLVAATPVAGPVLLVPPTGGESLVKHVLYAVVGGLLVLSCVDPPDGAFRRVVGAAPVRHLGATSYSLFCLHMTVLYLTMRWTGWEIFEGRLGAVLGTVLVVSLLCAEVSYRVVERPVMRWRRRVDARRPTSVASTGSATTSSTTR